MSVLTDLPKLLKAGIRKYSVPGASLAVLRNSRVTTAAAGVINVDTAVSTTPDSVFQIGSISKIFTTTLVMQLLDEGKLDLDEPLLNYLPGFRVADSSVSRAVTVRQLLCHSSGIDGDFFPDSGRGEDCVARLQDMGAMLPNLYPPGERMSYCNFGFAMLGRVVEVMTGETFDQAMRKRIFKPLGMKHAMTLPEDTLRYRAAIGHVPHPKKKGVNIQTPMIYLAHGQKAAGSTPTMSAADLMKFIRMHMDGGTGADGTRILSRKSVAAMQRRQLKMLKYSPRGVTGWGLGWFLSNWSGKRVYGHDGGTVGQYAFLRVLPEKNLAVALLTNGGDAQGLYADIFANSFARLGRVAETQQPLPRQGLKVDADALLGNYGNITTTLEISSGRDGLAVSIDPSAGPTAANISNVPLAFIDRNTAVLRSGDPIVDRTTLLFSDYRNGQAQFVSNGFRQLKRLQE